MEVLRGSFLAGKSKRRDHSGQGQGRRGGELKEEIVGYVYENQGG